MKYAIAYLFYFIDEFCKVYEEWERHKLLPSARQRFRQGEMNLSELLTIAVYYHLSGYKCLKYFYIQEMLGRQRSQFPRLVTYERFVQLLPRLYLPLHLLLHYMSGEKTGMYFVDATTLSVCHNKRIHSNRVFAGLAKRGKTSMGWFYGFKLHMVINHKGQIMAVKITQGNVDDRLPVPQLAAGLEGLLAADKGYISKKLFQELYARGLKIISGIRKGMKNCLVPIHEKRFRRKRFLIETVFDILKNIHDTDHSRHRSPANFAINAIAAIVAYQYTKINVAYP